MNLINFKIIPGPELVEEPARLVSSLICAVEWAKKFVEITEDKLEFKISVSIVI